MLSPFQDILCFLMHLIADGIRVVARRSDQEIQRLRPCVTAALGHDVVQLAVRLGMQFIEHHAVDIKAMLVRHVGGQSLVLAARGNVLHFLLAGFDVHLPFQLRLPPYHLQGNVKNDLRLVSVCGASVDLRARLKIRTEKIQRHSCRKFALALLFRYLDVCRIELTVSVRFQNAENVPDDLFLPVDQFKRLTIPRAFRVAAEFLYKAHSMVGGILVVVRIRRHESGGLVFLQFSHLHHLPEWHKK